MSKPIDRPLGRVKRMLIQDVSPLHQHTDPVQQRPPHQALERTPQVTTHDFAIKTATKPKRWQKLQRFKNYMPVAIAVLVVIASTRLSSIPIVGEVIVGIYGILAVIFKIPSRTTFALASAVLVSIGIEFLFLPGQDRANHSALFVFMLLGIGLVSSILETRRVSSQKQPLRRI